jgi:hypothetical protein
MYFRNISLLLVTVVILELFNLRCICAAVRLKKQYRPVYVPYIFQLFGDKGWESETKSFTGAKTTKSTNKVTTDAVDTSNNKIPYNTQTSRKKTNVSEINLKGTGRLNDKLMIVVLIYS